MLPRQADWARPARRGSQGVAGGRSVSGAVACSLTLWTGLCAAQGASATGALSLQPSITLSQTLTDNYQVTATNAASDAVTRLGAGVVLRARSGLVQGFLDYAMTGVLYARHSGLNSLQNALNANLATDLIEDRLQLNAAAGISRSAVSAFGVQAGAGTDANSNTTEVRTLRVSPALRGPLGPNLRYDARLSYQVSDAADGSLGDSDSTTASLHIEPTSRGRLSWSVDAQHQLSSFKLGRSTRTDRLFGALLLALPEQDLQLRGTLGVERTDQLAINSRSYKNWGLGAVWAPSPVTRLSADTENRYYGRSHSVSLEHRTPRTIFRYRNARSASSDTNTTPGRRGTAFDLLFAQLASAQPDPVLREDLVNRLLRDQGIDPRQVAGAGFLQSASSVQDLQEFSAAWTGPRNAIVASLGHTKTRRLDPLSGAVDDLSGGTAVSTDNLSLNVSHRLTPLSSLNMFLTVQRGSGQFGGQSISQNVAELQYSTRLTPDSTLGLNLRRAHYKTGQVPYDETAATATYGKRF
ncbi:MAG: TIGR03016 family PEP-CTERM system-associated outer membrane protein [Aquabacterium sp.]|nr:TIGR03016 family PEP-CTERM system-associated outer membrane protein [Aquabacterium sp.]